MQIKKLKNILNIEKANGIPPYKAVLGIINTSMLGVKRLSKLERINDRGLAVLSGLPELPSDSFYHNFLEGINLKDSENFNRHLYLYSLIITNLNQKSIVFKKIL